ncbi:MBL fold metallo-hydrolase [Agriterribacter sp.]|uniref:MBL fold metallo-hydrolase n=1 Tax=Agriterribacter sp. TaxID=2821509 RepID=UPI002D1D3739|nr:MBL fold metallo-hydrolase [Agriterribacter sp.]HRP54518.1 MBL fold metallo-hydrolase [Agriterribacter sp.]
MKIIPLSEGAFTVDQSKQFVPFNLTRDDLLQRSAGSLLVEIQPFVVITSKDVLLIDAGLGFSDADGTLQIHRNLISNNINPSDITKVLMSHLHKDHAGGVSLYDKMLNQRFLSFPNATYYVQQEELMFALQKGLPSFIPDEIEILQLAGNVHFLKGDGIIDDYIRYEITAAHSPWHQVFWIEENGETIFYGADDAPQLHQMKSRFVAKYDYDGKKCMELRQQWWQRGQQEKWTFLFYHDVKNPVWSFK